MTARENWNACENGKDHPTREGLIEVALGAPAPPGFDQHLASCRVCRETLAGLRARTEQMDAELRALVHAEGPSPAFRGRLMEAIEQQRPAWFGRRIWAGAIACGVALAVLAIIVTVAVSRRGEPAGSARALSAAPALSEWRSPTEALLRSSADELLKSTPKFGESYFPLPSRQPRPGQEDQRRNP